MPSTETALIGGDGDADIWNDQHARSLVAGFVWDARGRPWAHCCGGGDKWPGWGCGLASADTAIHWP